MERVVLILGAGASVPYFDPPLTTTALTEAVCNRSRWTDILQRYHAIAQGANTIEKRAVFDLLDWLQNPGVQQNFEDYIEITDKVASYAFDSTGNTIFHAVVKFLQGKLNFYSLHTWTAVPFLFRQLIAERIEEKHRCETSPRYYDLVAGLGCLLKHLSQGRDLSVVTFNYDDVLLDALSSVGIVIEDGFGREYFDAQDYLNGHSIMGFPHGHCRFVLDGNGLRRYHSIKEANEKRLGNLYGAQIDETRYLLGGSNCYNFNTFMTSGRDKDSSFNTNPFAAYYQRLAHDLLYTKVVIVIGFSLQDAHICRLLVNYRKLRPENRILVVDYDPNPIDVVRSFKDPSSLIYRLLDTVDVHSIPLSGNLANYGYRLQTGVDELNNTGVGDIYLKISYCKLGLDGFLADHQGILHRTCSL